MRLAVITDIHEDLESLMSCLRKIEKTGCDEIISLGDICGFSIPYYNYLKTRNASECVRLVKENCRHSIIGNHDLYAIRKLPENIQNFVYPEDWYSLSYHERKKLADEKVWLYEENELDALLNQDNIEYLNSLPEFVKIETEKYNLFFSHYLYPDLTGCTRKMVLQTDAFYEHYKQINESKNTVAIFGHMHSGGLLRVVKNDLIINKKPIKYLNKVSGISGPVVTQNSSLNGFMIIDTNLEQVIPYFLNKYWF